MCVQFLHKIEPRRLGSWRHTLHTRRRIFPTDWLVCRLPFLFLDFLRIFVSYVKQLPTSLWLLQPGKVKRPVPSLLLLLLLSPAVVRIFDPPIFKPRPSTPHGRLPGVLLFKSVRAYRSPEGWGGGDDEPLKFRVWNFITDIRVSICIYIHGLRWKT